MKPVIIGLAGMAGSGKDEAAKALTATGWERRAFADILRTFLYTLNPSLPSGMGSIGLKTVVDRIGWEAAKNNYPEVRRLLQRVGTDCGRELLGNNVWVDAAFKAPITTSVVFTDVRFPNEVKAIRDRGGIVLRIVRDGVQPLTLADGSIHPSETALDAVTYDGVLTNNHTVENLHAKVEAWGDYLTRVHNWKAPKLAADLGVNTGWA